MAAVYARKRSALARLQEAYCSKLKELMEAKAARDRHGAAEAANEMIITDAGAAIETTPDLAAEVRDPAYRLLD
ncbi:hypothetical protein I6F35_29670 [Bradyrhizobium sp. BRP22]|uniref:hypothetical protein n=1 Tax=Bradyrhizobium sp. BRP22 TaxID=2793821 RepID=UPI001CD37C50|nr:hypothetical protein [Bradyrhizobium sp. BRP22]MCA1457314.1 hypothetical protein [Bradyrhizobium sp. BRP22]